MILLSAFSKNNMLLLCFCIYKGHCVWNCSCVVGTFRTNDFIQHCIHVREPFFFIFAPQTLFCLIHIFDRSFCKPIKFEQNWMKNELVVHEEPSIFQKKNNLRLFYLKAHFLKFTFSGKVILHMLMKFEQNWIIRN